MADDRAERFELSLADETDLLIAIAEAERGETVNAEDVFRQIRPKRPTVRPEGN